MIENLSLSCGERGFKISYCQMEKGMGGGMYSEPLREWKEEFYSNEDWETAQKRFIDLKNKYYNLEKEEEKKED